ncbi:CmcJ/NvfI family oxidoreductase [Granulosicoccus antarcticus]|uniref:Methyltransferase n=1 Tax=Granulosicoccus antarcticus IMCC3135 TaxID=1192854 RepID=A0A2Z2NQS7_9GAMM|nr:CmcJ/NvfI family oxidoreductase [Granulosicoccus antarcticus]ASJ72048.1 hypothetical protein IMCC3135_09760 [Granulosicoccus antarcticus IMCC3135]
MADVKTQLNYSVDNGREIDYYFFEPAQDVKLNPPGTDVQDVVIRDGWSQAESFSLDAEGFAIKSFDGGFRQFDNEEAITSLLYPQVIEFIKKQTGARRVEIFDKTIRQRLPDDLSQQTEEHRPAVLLVHSDYTPRSGPARVRDILPEDADELLTGRVVFYNFWKSLYDVVEELPLACCDARSSIDEDMLLMNLKYSDRTGEIYVLRHSPDHKWWYFPKMSADHALLLKTYDSEIDGRARFMGHSAFEDPTTPVGAQPRQSIEIRTMAFF